MPLVFSLNVPLAPMTTLKVGGPAKYFAEIRTEEEAQEAFRFAREKDLPVFVLGGGSNVVISDTGFPGLVLRNELKGFREEGEADGKVLVAAASGEDWDALVVYAVARDLQGIENMSGVPGTVGSAPVQNVACYGQSVSEVIREVRGVDMRTGERKVWSNEECRFRYRDSRFRSEEPGRYFVTEVVVALAPGGKVNLSSYQDVAKYAESLDHAPSLTEVRRAILAIRAKKGMTVLPEHEVFQSVGSFFKNPAVSRELFEKTRIKIETEGGPGCEGNWFWEQGDKVKMAAACLLERSGFPKGQALGKVGISPKHSLAVVNLGGATAAEVAGFVKSVRAAVREKFGVELEPEAEAVGFAEAPW